jgi:hypothetical protein
MGGRHRPALPQHVTVGQGHDHVVGELVEAPLDAEVGREGEREYEGVRGHVPTGVIADHQHWALLGDVPEVSDFRPEPQAGKQPQQRHPLAQVVWIAFVEVGG